MPKIVDLTHKKFGLLTAIKRDSNKKYHWICQCECGNIKSISRSNLKNGATKSCGCLKISDITGIKFKKLLVIKPDEKRNLNNNNGDRFWLCKCDCGKIISVSRSNLKSGKTRSCGCLVIEINLEKRNKKEEKIRNKKLNIADRKQKYLLEKENRIKEKETKKRKNKEEKDLNNKTEILCLNCNSSFLIYKHRLKTRKYCSWKCRSSHMRGANAPSFGKKSWMEGANNPNWIDGRSKERSLLRKNSNGLDRRWRTRVFHRDDYICQSCGCESIKGRKLNAHHIAPWSTYPHLRYDLSNGITLCEVCHKQIHKDICLKQMNDEGVYLIKWLTNGGYAYDYFMTAAEYENLMGWEPGCTAKGITADGKEINISETQRKKMLGNGIICQEITELLEGLKPILDEIL